MRMGGPNYLSCLLIPHDYTNAMAAMAQVRCFPSQRRRTQVPLMKNPLIRNQTLWRGKVGTLARGPSKTLDTPSTMLPNHH